MSDSTIRVALAGIGSCASSFVQLTALAEREADGLAGVVHERIGGYSLRGIEYVAAFDVDQAKVGLDLAEAIRVGPTAAVAHVPVGATGVTVRPGPVLDGLDGRLSEVITPHRDALRVNAGHVESALRESGAEVLVCFLPTGSREAVKAYARACAEAGTAFVNATPEHVANDPELAELFARRAVPLLGDDLRSQLGATALHTALLELMHSRGIWIRDTYQLNVGGNMDFYNLSDPVRSHSKQVSKRKALASAGIDARDVAAGPNGYVKFLGDRKVCFLRIEGEASLGSSICLDIRLEVEDSPNAAAVVASAVRVARCAADQGLGGVLDPVCAFLFKSPPTGMPESEALRAFEEFVVKANAFSGAAQQGLRP